ncbi:MAG: DedA family protein [Deltaproteobacteria bacterium]|nr:DedA family protein [Deltaproteobacteria bacterium]
MDFLLQVVDVLKHFIDIFRHLDTYLAALVVEYGVWIYAILFVVIFCETGLVVTPFLPGDSLLFTAGAIAATSAVAADGTPQAGLSMAVMIPLLFVAAVFGDAVNFAIGSRVGPGILEKEKIPFIKKAHIEKTQAFYERHGSKTIVLARFVPIVRTFAPFVAGIGKMRYATFATYNVVGAIAWVGICLGAGFFFGNIPVVKQNFELVVLGIIAVSVLPMAIEILNGMRKPPPPT